MLVTLHVALSVGSLGAPMVMLTLAIAAQVSQPATHARSAYWANSLVRPPGVCAVVSLPS